jgi:hypothetical protein
MADDAVSAGDMWKNFGMNLGMDALGLIPGGGVASKMGKIVKTLKGTVPLIIALPGVASMLANSPEIAKSWKKAFDGDPENEHKPSNYSFNYVVYTGTHDNMPMYQYVKDLTLEEHESLVSELVTECKLLNVKPNVETDKEVVETLVELGFASKANMCIIPMQDLLVQDGTTRMNLPSTVSTNNWSYRVKEEELSEELSMKLASLAKTYKR